MLRVTLKVWISYFECYTEHTFGMKYILSFLLCGGHGSSFSPRKDAENTQGHEASVSGTGLEPSWYSHEDFHMSQDGTFSHSIREPSRTQVMSWPCGTTSHACASEDAMSHNITLSSGATGHIETRREVVSGTVPSVPPPPPLIPYYSPGGNSSHLP